jgi:hypothetical protein
MYESEVLMNQNCRWMSYEHTPKYDVLRVVNNLCDKVLKLIGWC